MSESKSSTKALARTAVVALLLFLVPAAWPQAAAPSAAKTPPAAPEPPKDTLGRSAPRGTVLGFLGAIRKGNTEIAVLYLNTPLRGEAAEILASQLALVLDRRLPARLNEISEKPEGSLPDPLRPDEDTIGTIATAKGDLELHLERVDRGKAGKVWLFSRKTLEAIPDVYQEINTPPVEKFLPPFLVKTRLAGIPLFQILAVFLGLPLLYLLTGVLNRVLSWSFGALLIKLRRNSELRNFSILPPPLRLLLLVLTIHWLLSRIGLTFLARQFWSSLALIITVAATVWVLMLLNGKCEHYLVQRRGSLSGSNSVLRLGRRLVDTLILFSGLLFILHHFGVNLTGALAGLGVGGIAVALAAQKTLENVIAGVSLIADEAVRVGDALKIGDISGTVVEVGLRSTRIRTLDRTLVSLPNGQISNVSLETLSARDKFWFHPIIGLRYETTASQLRAIIASTRDLLVQHRSVELDSVRVRFIRLGPFSQDIEIFAYVFALDWNQFLEIQEQLLLHVLDIVEKAGAVIAFPSQTTYLVTDSPDRPASPAPAVTAKRPLDARAG